jgi:DnaJ-class molecular chaperone
MGGQGMGAGAGAFGDAFSGRPGQGATRPRPGAPATPPSSYERPVFCTLEELYNGATKKLLKVSFGNKKGYQQQQQLYEVKIHPGWKDVTYRATAPSPQMLFVVQEMPHSVFRRRGNDLVYRYRLPREDNNLGEQAKRIRLSISMMDGTTWTRGIDAASSLVRRGRSLTVPYLGMPIRAAAATAKSGGGVKQEATRGNLVIEFE